MSSNSHKKRRDPPQLYQATPHVATQAEITVDRRRVKLKVTHLPSQLDDNVLPPPPPSVHAQSSQTPPSPVAAPQSAPNLDDYLLGESIDDSLSETPSTNDGAQDGVRVFVNKRSTSSTNPMGTWLRYREDYLRIMLLTEGRRSASDNCPGCTDQSPALFRCRDEECVGRGILCKDCCRAAHEHHPLHWVEKWNGSYFEHVNLSDIGVAVHLMHRDSCCPMPHSTTRSFTVIHTNGIHSVSLFFCGCSTAPPYYEQLLQHMWYPATPLQPQTATTFSLLKIFHHLNTIGKLPVYDLWKALEAISENFTCMRPPSCYAVLLRCVRQFRHLRMVKRAGRGHDDDGIAGTPRGGLAIQCPACPHPGENMDKLPEGDKRWVGRLFLAVDANFRARNAMVSSIEKDPPLADGKSFFIEQKPYMDFVKSNAAQGDIDACSGFRATQLADLKNAKGLRTTGVVGVTCSRHGVWRANGMGNLQRGERFCNVDPVLCGSTVGDNDKDVVFSYDIACIYDKNFWTRMAALPVEWRMERTETSVHFFIPKVHIIVHQRWKHAIYSFNYRPGVGMTHGETIEENWSSSNRAAAQTKMMGPGARQDTLEDIWNHHNWRTIKSFEHNLPKRLVDAIKQARIHLNDFEKFTQGLSQYLGDDILSEWQSEITAWERDSNKPCPFEPEEQIHETLNDVKLQLLKEEQASVLRMTGIVHESSMAVLLNLGLEIEVMQRSLAWEVKARSQGTSYQELNIQKQRTNITKQIVKLRGLQRIFMPHLEEYLNVQQLSHFNMNTDVHPEERKLLMLSELDAASRAMERACSAALIKGEERLREAEAREALDGLRSGLRMRSAGHAFTIRNVTGQNPTTRAQGILRNIQVSIQLHKLRYRYARGALLRLRGPGLWREELQELSDTDIRGINERLLTAEEAAERERLHHLGIIDESTGALPDPEAVISHGEGRRQLSWIWYTYSSNPAGANNTETPKIHEAFKIEWSKAHARKHRWLEEIELLTEEMSRVVRYGRSRAAWWRNQKGKRSGTSPALRQGLDAYAEENAVREENRAKNWEEQWSGLIAVGRDVLAGVPVTNIIDFVVEEDEAQADETQEEGDNAMDVE